MKSNTIRHASFFATACCLAASFAASRSAAEPAVLRATRVIQCECDAENEKRPAVVTGVTMTPDGRTIAAATDDHFVTVWDAGNAEIKGRFNGHVDWVRSVVLSQDGKTVASGAGDRSLRMWDIPEHRGILELPGCDNTVASVCFHPNSQQLAIVGFSNTLKIVNCSTGTVNQTLACPCSDTRTVTFSPDGSRMAVAGRNGQIRIWNVNNGKQERDIETDGRRIRALAFSPDGKRLVAAGSSREIRVIDTTTGNTQMTLSTRPALVYSLLFLDDNRLATGGTDNSIWLWDLNGRQATTKLVGHTGTVAALACDSQGKMLVSGSYDTTVRIWNLAASPVPVTAARASADSAR